MFVRDDACKRHALQDRSKHAEDPHHSKENAMKSARRQLPSRSRGITILAAGVLFATSLAFVGGCDESSDPDAPRAKTQNEVTDTARAVKETAQATSAIIRLNGATGGNDSAAAPLTPDPTIVPPVDGDGGGDILEELLEGLLGF
jgi:hypothetical protein